MESDRINRGLTPDEVLAKRRAAEEYENSARKSVGREALAAVGSGAACRESGRNALLSRARQLHREANALEALAASIPDNFPHDADEALWELAIRHR